MANQHNIDPILALHRGQWSIWRIAATLGIHRDTIAPHLRQAKQAGAPTDSGEGKIGQAPTAPTRPGLR